MAEPAATPKPRRERRHIMFRVESASGYTIAECRAPEVCYTITRPGGKAPSFYTPDRLQVAKLIDADERAQA